MGGASDQSRPSDALINRQPPTNGIAAPGRETRTTPQQRTPSQVPVDGHDLLFVARAYTQARHSYRWDDPAGYARAVTAAAFSTEAFAARSHPDASALDRLRTAQESSTVRVGAAQVDGEAPNSATVRYVNVAFVSTVTYRGDGSGRPRAEVWDLRLVWTRAGRWRVDGVPSTS